MIFFLDENFPKAAAPLVEAYGHASRDIRGTIHEGASDVEIFDMAQQHKAVFLTTDRDFFHTVPLLFQNHHGVVVVALRQPNRRRILERLAWFLENIQTVEVRNRVYELREQSYVVFPRREEREDSMKDDG